MAARDTRWTSLARVSAEHNERQVLAARALENERRVTAVRLIALGLMAVSQGVIGDLTGVVQDDPARDVAVAIYIAFAIIAFVAVRRATLTIPRVRFMPLLATTFDIGFCAAMDWIDLQHGTVELESSTIFLALVISYSLLRYGVESLLYATALSIAVFTAAQVGSGQFAWTRWSFVAFGFIACATLFAFTRQAVRRAFVDLKRRESLSRLVAPKVVDEILAGREDRLQPARREVTILFADLRDFTSYSESRAPEDVLRFLDDYFGRMTQVVQAHDGSVNKFIGDGLMALWGAPAPLAGHAAHAVKAALDMRKVMLEINEHREAGGEPPLHVGIGIHTGEVAAGMLGGSGQTEYSVIGDAVNLASRIEGLTKEHGGKILVSDATWDRLEGRFAGERIGEVVVKGRRGRVVLHALTEPAPDVP